MSISVLVVDDHRVVRAGLIALLRQWPDIDVVGEAGDGQEAIERAAELEPDVVLMDLQMPVMDGVEATKRIVEETPTTAVLILTTFDDDELIWEGIRAGARGYMLKDAPPDQLVEGLRTVASGHALLPPDIASKLTHMIRHRSSDASAPQNAPMSPATDAGDGKLRPEPARAGSLGPATEPASATTDPASDARARGRTPQTTPILTARETEIVQLIAAGHSNRDIAATLFISENTVKTHISNVYEKLDVNDRTGAVTTALRFGLIRLD